MSRAAYKKTKAASALHERFNCDRLTGYCSIIKENDRHNLDVIAHKVNTRFFVSRIYEDLKQKGKTAELRKAFIAHSGKPKNSKQASYRIISLILALFLEEACKQVIKYNYILYLRTKAINAFESCMYVAYKAGDYISEALRRKISPIEELKFRVVRFDTANRKLNVTLPINLSNMLIDNLSKGVYYRQSLKK